MKKTWIAIIGLLTILTVGIAGCGSSEATSDLGTKEGVPDEVLAEIDNQETTVSEDFFEWDGNIIIRLTDEGKNQKSLVIPERCEGFETCLFASDDCMVKEVSFESNKDIDLNGVFMSAYNIEKILLPENLTTIGEMDFWYCKSLASIEIPITVTVIEGYAFQGASSLSEVVFPENLVTIGAHAFDNCEKLSNVKLPNTLTTIEEYAFYKCPALEKIILPASLKKVAKGAFMDGGLKEITVDKSLENLTSGDTAFTQWETVTVYVAEGSWMDQNFDNVFVGSFDKVYQN